MAAGNFQIIIITQETSTHNEAEHIVQLFEEGLQILHIRKPGYTIGEIRSLLIAIPPVFHPKIVIHSHYDLLHDFNLKGEHLPESIRTGSMPLVDNKIVSTSFHNLDDILMENTNFEYAFYSPVFESISKQGYLPSTDANTFEHFFHSNKAVIHFPIIALGGITGENILQTKKIGFQGAACIGFIWNNPNPAGQFKKLQKAVQG